jgi:hypothetical protein
LLSTQLFIKARWIFPANIYDTPGAIIPAFLLTWIRQEGSTALGGGETTALRVVTLRKIDKPQVTDGQESSENV